MSKNLILLLFTVSLFVAGCKKDKEDIQILKSASESTVLTPQGAGNNLPPRFGFKRSIGYATVLVYFGNYSW